MPLPAHRMQLVIGQSQTIVIPWQWFHSRPNPLELIETQVAPQ